MASLPPVPVAPRPSLAPPSIPSLGVAEASPSAPDTQEWAEIELGRTEFRDARRTKRLIGEPGLTVIGRGLQRLSDIAQAWRLFHPLAASPQIVGNDQPTRRGF